MEEYIRDREERERIKQQGIEMERMKEKERRKAATKEVARFRERVSYVLACDYAVYQKLINNTSATLFLVHFLGIVSRVSSIPLWEGINYVDSSIIRDSGMGRGILNRISLHIVQTRCYV